MRGRELVEATLRSRRGRSAGEPAKGPNRTKAWAVKRLAFVGGLLMVLLAVAAAGFWAGRIALAPPADPLAERAEPVTYQVVEQTLGQSLQFCCGC